MKAVFCQGLFSEQEAQDAIEMVREAGIRTIELLGGVRPEPLVPEEFLKLKKHCPEGMQFKVTGPFVRQSEVLGFLKAGVNWVGTPEARLVLEDDEEATCGLPHTQGRSCSSSQFPLFNPGRMAPSSSFPKYVKSFSVA